jgi:hypothetical protein
MFFSFLVEHIEQCSGGDPVATGAVEIAKNISPGAMKCGAVVQLFKAA